MRSSYLRMCVCLLASFSLMLWSACNIGKSGGGGGKGGGNSPVSIEVNGTFPVGTVGATYPAQSPPVLAVGAGTAPFTWTVSSAASTFPPGLTLGSQSEGSVVTVTGTPTTAGTYTFTAQVTDAANTTASQKMSITVDAALSFTTTSLPNGTAGTNYSGQVNAAGGAPPYTFYGPATGTLPTGLSMDTTGAISGEPTAAGTFNFSVQVTDSINNSQTGNFSIIIAAAPALTVTTTSLPTGTAGVAYPTAQLAASGGIPPYNSWAVISGTPPSGLTVNYDGTVTGTPSASGTVNFTVQVTDSVGSNASGNVSVTVNPGTGMYACGTGVGYEYNLNGQYAFLLNGFDDSGNATVVAGSFAASSGSITSGEQDYNNAASGPAHQVITGGAYSLGSDDRGCLTLSTASQNTTYSFVLSTMVSGTGRMIEFDDATGTGGTRMAGILRQQQTGLALNLVLSNYAFGVSGRDSSDNPAAMAGSFTLNTTTGNISNGYADLDDAGTLTTKATGITGTLPGISAVTGRGSMTYALASGAVDFTAYFVSPSEFFLVGADAVATAPVSSGEAIATSSSFSAASLMHGYIFGTSGYSTGSSGADVNIGQLSFDGVSVVTGTMMEDKAGTSSSTAVPGGSTYAVDPVAGRVTFTGISAHLPVAYLTDGTTDGIVAFVVGTDNSASSGIVEQQTSAPYSSNSLAGNYIVGTMSPADETITNQVGNLGFTSGLAAGIEDESQPGANGLLVSQALNQTYTINADGTGNAGTNTAAVTNGSTIYFIDETPGKDPSILVIQQ